MDNNPVSIDSIIEYTTTNHEGTVVNYNWGEQGLFYNPDNVLPKGIYILTFKEKDGPNDKASNLNREGYYRLNLGISKVTFMSMFGSIPSRPTAGKIVNTGHNFQDVDTLMPHPVYGWMAWIGVINPGKSTFEKLKPLIAESIELAKIKYQKKVG